MSGPMNLVFPTPGASTDVWGVTLNTMLGLVEQHDHTSGKGSLIRSSALGINADVSWASYALTAAKTVTFVPVTAASMTSYANAFYVNVADNNLWWRNSSGTPVQITAAGQLNLAAVGGIGGDYAAVSALFSYDDATRRYLAQQEGLPRPWAGFATGDIDLYQKAASITNKVTLKSPAALAASYSMTLPAAVPAQAAPLTMSTTGAVLTDGVLGANQNMTFQGTGHALRGNRSFTIPIRYTGSYNVSGGLASVASIGYAGAQCPASSENGFFLAPAIVDEQLMTITSAVVYARVSGGGAVTFSLLVGTTGGNFAPITGATATTSSLGQYSPITITPATPFTYSFYTVAGGFLSLDVVVAAGVTCNVLSVVLNTTVVT